VINSGLESNRQDPYRLLDTVAAVFVTVLLVSNIASAAKIVDLRLSIGNFPLAFDGGTFLFPLSYIFGDVLTEVYGYRKSRRVIWTGFGCAVLSRTVGLRQDSRVGWKRGHRYGEHFRLLGRRILKQLCLGENEDCNPRSLALDSDYRKYHSRGRYRHSLVRGDCHDAGRVSCRGYVESHGGKLYFQGRR